MSHSDMSAPDAPRMSIPAAAERLGVDVRVLRGWVWNGFVSSSALKYPVGGLSSDEIYVWEVERLELRKRRHDQTGAPPELTTWFWP